MSSLKGACVSKTLFSDNKSTPRYKNIALFPLIFFLITALSLFTMVVLNFPAFLLLAALAFVLFISTGAEANIRSLKRRSPTHSLSYKQTTRAAVIARGLRPARVVAAAKRQASPPVFPLSTCEGYTSTGSVPWAVYTGVDIDGSEYTLVDSVPTREACYVRCEQSSGTFV